MDQAFFPLFCASYQTRFALQQHIPCTPRKNVAKDKQHQHSSNAAAEPPRTHFSWLPCKRRQRASTLQLCVSDFCAQLCILCFTVRKFGKILFYHHGTGQTIFGIEFIQKIIILNFADYL